MFTVNIPSFFLVLPSISLGIRHFLNPLTIISGEMHCHGLDRLAQQFHTVLPYCHSIFNPYKWQFSHTIAVSPCVCCLCLQINIQETLFSCHFTVLCLLCMCDHYSLKVQIVIAAAL
jgi:hypothetical protein